MSVVKIGAGILFAGGSLLGFLLGVKILWEGVRRLGTLKRIWGDAAEPVDVADVTPGSVAVSGMARPAAAGTIAAPFSDGEALVAVGATLERISGADEASGGVGTDERVIETVPFAVEDGTGSIRVDPGDGGVHVEQERFEPEAVDRTAFATWQRRTGIEGESSVGYAQRVVAPGDEVYVFGEAVPADEDSGEGNDPGRSDLRIAGDGDGGNALISTDGRDRVGGNSLLSGIVFLLLGGLFLFFALGLLLGAVAFLLG